MDVAVAGAHGRGRRGEGERRVAGGVGHRVRRRRREEVVDEDDGVDGRHRLRRAGRVGHGHVDDERIARAARRRRHIRLPQLVVEPGERALLVGEEQTERLVEVVDVLRLRFEVDLVRRVLDGVVPGRVDRRRRRRHAVAIDALDVGRNHAAEQRRHELHARVQRIVDAEARRLAAPRRARRDSSAPRPEQRRHARRRHLEVEHRQDRIVRDDAVLAQVVVAAVERDLLAVVADEDERVARLALFHAPLGHARAAPRRRRRCRTSR